MDFKELTDKVSTLAASKGGVGKTIKFATSDGAITINPDGTVSNTDGESDCTIGVSSSDLAALMSGDLNPMSAFMFGKLKVTGDMSVAMQLQSLF
jgi:putative sterol carrier protein